MFRLSKRFLSAPSIEAIEADLLFPRLEYHYYETLYPDMMIMNYDHSSHNDALLRNDDDWNIEFNQKLIDQAYLTNISQLPTANYTICTNLLTKTPEKTKTKMTKKLKNPIDYTSIPKYEFYPPPPEHHCTPFSPVPSRVPALKRVDLSIWTEDAVGNKSILLGAVMSLQSITGIRPEPVFATRGDSTKKIRAGMPMGAKVSLYGSEMYYFLDKLVQCVLPRIREWQGVNPVGDGKGSISLNLPAQVVGTFPDIEPHFDMFPRLFDVNVDLHTTGQSDQETILLLSGFQIPFLDKPVVDEVEVKKSNDPWELIKKAKTREERKRLFQEITARKKALGKDSEAEE